MIIFLRKLNLAHFRPIFDFELKGKKSRAEPKILKLKLWLEPARLGLITRLVKLYTLFVLASNSTTKGQLAPPPTPPHIHTHT